MAIAIRCIDCGHLKSKHKNVMCSVDGCRCTIYAESRVYEKNKGDSMTWKELLEDEGIKYLEEIK
jgi:hypothetical protein